MNRGLAALVPQRRLVAPARPCTTGVSATSTPATGITSSVHGQGSTTHTGDAQATGSGEEVDPLDAFMSSVHEQLQKAPSHSLQRTSAASESGGRSGADTGQGPVTGSATRDGLQQEQQRETRHIVVQSSLYEDSDEEQGAGYWSQQGPKAGGTTVKGAQGKADTRPEEEEDEDDEEGEDVDSRPSGAGGKRRRVEDIGTILHAFDHSPWQYSALQASLIRPPTEEQQQLEVPTVDAESVRREIGVTAVCEIAGPGSMAAIPPPVRSFMHLQLDGHACWPAVVRCMAKEGWEAPTAIQAQALPALLAGAHVLGLAATGQGKTLAYALPAVIHAYAHRSMVHPVCRNGGGGMPKAWDSAPSPLSLILCPTRELAQQVYETVRKLARGAGLSVVLTIGGAGKWAQAHALREAEKEGTSTAYGPHIVVATPGRLIDHARDGALSLVRTGFLVLDEADRLLELGFGPQVTSLCSAVRPDRQVALFSATWPRKVQALAGAVVAANGRTSLRISVSNGGDIAAGEGTSSAGSENQSLRIVQRLVYTPRQDDKWSWLQGHLLDLQQHALQVAAGHAGGHGAQVQGQMSPVRTIIFVSSKDGCDQLCNSLNGCSSLRQALGIHPAGRLARSLHGGHLHSDRESALAAFRAGGVPLLVATDVASRGLDIADVGLVLSYDAPRSLETHTHRIGRTGRLRAAQTGIAGGGEVIPGLAVTLLTQEDKGITRDIVRSLEEYDVTGEQREPAVSVSSHSVEAALVRIAGQGHTMDRRGAGGQHMQQQHSGLGTATGGGQGTGSSHAFLQSSSLGWAQNPLTAGARVSSSNGSAVASAPQFVRATAEQKADAPQLPMPGNEAPSDSAPRAKKSRWGAPVPTGMPQTTSTTTFAMHQAPTGEAQAYRAPMAAAQLPLAANRALYQPGMRY